MSSKETSCAWAQVSNCLYLDSVDWGVLLCPALARSDRFQQMST